MRHSPSDHDHRPRQSVGGFLKGRGMSFTYAWTGIKALFKTEHNAQFHLGTAVAVIGAGFFFNITPAEWAVVAICIGGMFCAEALNTAIEKLCDFVQPDHDERIGRIKDIAAGAVLMFTIGVVIAGLIIFVPYIIDVLKH